MSVLMSELISIPLRYNLELLVQKLYRMFSSISIPLRYNLEVFQTRPYCN